MNLFLKNIVSNPYFLPVTVIGVIVLMACLAFLVWKISRKRSSQKNRKVEADSTYFLVSIFILSTVGIIVSGFIYYRYYEIKYRSEVEKQLSAIADLKVNEISQWRKERLGDASVYYKNDPFSLLVKQFFESPQDVSVSKELRIWLRKIRTAYSYDKMLLLDSKGNVRMSEPESSESLAVHHFQDVAKTIDTKSIHFLDFHRDSADGPAHLALLIPIVLRKGEGIPLGVLVMKINPEKYLYPLIQRWPGDSKTAETLLIRKNGEDVLFLNELKFQKNTALNLRFPLNQKKDLPAAMVLMGKEGIVQGKDYRGVPVIASVRVIPDSPWCMVARMDISEVYIPLRERLWIIIIIFGGLIVGTGFGIGFIWRHQRVRFYKEKFKDAEALRESEARYRRILDSMLEGCQILGHDWRYIYINEEAEKHNRRSKEEFLGKKYMDMWPGIEHTKVFGLIRQCMEEQVVQYMENNFVFPDGHKGWFTLRIQPVQEGVMILSTDITEKKTAEEKEKHFISLIKAMRRVNQLITKEKDRDQLISGACENLVVARGFNNTWIALMNASGKLLHFAQSGLADIAGRLKELLEKGRLPKCVQKAMTQKEVVVITNTSVDCVDCPIASFYKNSGAFCLRLEYGSDVFGIITAEVPHRFIHDQEERELFQELGDDIAFGLSHINQEQEREKADKALKESEGRFKTLFEYAPDAYYIHDFDGRFIDGNRAAEDLIGFKKEEMIGKRFKDIGLLSPEEIEKARRFLDKNRKGISTGPDELVVKRKGGKQLFVEIRTFPLAMMGQDIVLGIARDISERKNLEMQLQQSQKLESIGRLAGGIAHDFNNLLTTIIGNTEIALLDSTMDQGLKSEIEGIKSAGEKAASLTRQLLAFSRKQITQPKVMNLNATLKEMEKMVHRLIGEDIELEMILPQDLGHIEADPGQIEQVVMNLIVNARDAMPKGGKITIETSNKDIDKEYALQHIAVMPGPYIMLSVSDTGIGMTNEIQSQIFEPFYTTKEKGKGTGLGLSMVYGIVKQNSGNIWVYSEPGKGTTFKIYLPRVEKMVFESKVIKKDGELTGTETILIVEDDEAVRNFVEKALKKYGFIILKAENGTEAINVSADYKHPIDLLLTDVVIPEMKVKVLVEKLLSERPEIKVLYMSGYTDNTIVKHGVLDTGSVFLEKPFTPDSLALKVREVLDSAEERDSEKQRKDPIS